MDWGYIISVMIVSAFGVEAIVFGLAAIGINMQFGYTGLLNFGQAAFMAVGGYSIAVTVVHLGLNFWIGIVIGLLGAVVLALILGIPTLRLRADYLAIVTIAAAEIVRLLVRSVTFKSFFGGSDGLQSFSSGFFALNPLADDLALRIGPVVLSNRQIFVLVVGWALVFLSCLLVWLMVRSPWGRVLKGIREDEDAVRSLGKNVYLYKMQALVLGGMFGAIAGFVYAVGNEAVSPDFFGNDTTFFAYAILILGGAARVFGPVLGTVIFWAVIQGTDVFLRSAINQGVPILSLMTGTQAAVVRFMLVGLGIMLLMIFRPQGILGDRKELALDAR
ncbi:MAG: branched-chain amino acid ABC transporter permease [Actinobacteria bacterium]|nr:branched-chain amino acid ABC transporter permease [Actinomycetota bacterium]